MPKHKLDIGISGGTQFIHKADEYWKYIKPINIEIEIYIIQN